jgi:predicted nucleotidyltransferase
MHKTNRITNHSRIFQSAILSISRTKEDEETLLKRKRKFADEANDKQGTTSANAIVEKDTKQTVIEVTKVKADVKEVTTNVKAKVMTEIKTVATTEIKTVISTKVVSEVTSEVKAETEVKTGVIAEDKVEVNTEIVDINNKIDPLKIDFFSFAESHKLWKQKIAESKCPWISGRTKRLKGMLKLHSEIYDFYNFIKPTAKENTLRNRTFDIVTNVVKLINSNWQVKLFGSYPKKIHLPDSDIDLIINTGDNDDTLDIFHQVKDKLIELNCVEFIRIVEARVSIIKALIRETQIYVDIR